MVNHGPNTNTSQFFFTLGATAELDKKNTLFGKVVGNTVFNMLKLGEGEIVEEIPVREHKIIKTEVRQIIRRAPTRTVVWHRSSPIRSKIWLPGLERSQKRWTRTRYAPNRTKPFRPKRSSKRSCLFKKLRKQTERVSLIGTTVSSHLATKLKKTKRKFQKSQWYLERDSLLHTDHCFLSLSLSA